MPKNELTDSTVKKLTTYLPDKSEDPRAYIELVKDQVMGQKGSLLDLTYFMRVAKNARLDPTLRQIYAIFRKNKIDGKWVEKMTIQTGIDGLRAGAEGTEKYIGSGVPEFGEEIDFGYSYEYKNKKYKKTIKVPSYVIIQVKKIINGDVFEIAGRADWVEFYPGDRQGMMWRKMPRVMLSKCAEAQALRKAFPIISGIYIDEEMQQVDNEEAIPLKEVVYELSKQEIVKIDKVKTKKGLLKICGEMRKKKGDKYLDSLMSAYSNKENELKKEKK